MITHQLKIDGMHCARCVQRVAQALREIPHLSVTNLDIGAAEVAFDETETASDTIVAKLQTAGYSATVTELR